MSPSSNTANGLQYIRWAAMFMEKGVTLMTVDLTKMKNAVAQAQGLMASTQVLVAHLVGELKDISSTTTDTATQQELDTLADQLTKSDTDLAVALAQVQNAGGVVTANPLPPGTDPAPIVQPTAGTSTVTGAGGATTVVGSTGDTTVIPATDATPKTQ